MLRARPWQDASVPKHQSDGPTGRGARFGAGQHRRVPWADEPATVPFEVGVVPPSPVSPGSSAPAPAEAPRRHRRGGVGTHSHGHGHGSGSAVAPPAGRRVRQLIAMLLVPCALATLIGVVLLWPSGDSGATTGTASQQTVRAVVTKAEVGDCTPGSGRGDCAALVVRLDDGPL